MLAPFPSRRKGTLLLLAVSLSMLLALILSARSNAARLPSKAC